MKCFQQRLFTGIMILVMVGIGCQTFAEPITITGAGASFPFPVYSQWAHTYYALTEMKLDYQSIGSGGGIAQIKAKTVDFGASDVPLQPAELDEFGLIQFPMVMGGVVAAVNIEGIKPGELRLNHNVLADIFLGNITTWNDPKIVVLNAGLTLPDQEITVVHRADGSGTTWIFTNYLDKVSTEWHEKVGTANTVKWPVGMAGKGNEGISQYVKKINGAVGYVELAYALQNNMAYILLENHAGKFVAPTIETFQAAASNADWGHAPGFYMVLTDQPGDESWPITGASFILMYKEQKDLARARALLKFFDWCYHQGTDLAQKLHYVPIPANVVAQVQALWENNIRVNGQVVWK